MLTSPQPHRTSRQGSGWGPVQRMDMSCGACSLAHLFRHTQTSHLNTKPHMPWLAAGGSAVPCLALPPEAHLYPLTDLGQSQQNLPSSWDPDQELQVLQAEHQGFGL